MAEKCKCGHHEPSHGMLSGHCNICSCEKFVRPSEEESPKSLADLSDRLSRIRGNPPIGSIVHILDLLSRSDHCWCDAGNSNLTPDHNETCLEVQAFYTALEMVKGG